MVLLLITQGVVGKHQWCGVLTPWQYAARAGAACCQESVILYPKANKSYLVSGLTFPKSI